VLIAGSPNDEGAKALHGAQMSVLQPYIARGDIKVLADAYTKIGCLPRLPFYAEGH